MRGTKRTADVASQEDEQDGGEDGDGNGDPTPRKKGSSAKHTKFQVVVTSPEHKRPKQRHSMDVDNEAEVDEGDETMEMDVSAEVDAVVAVDAVAAAPELWVATGEVSQYILHFHVC